MFDFFFVFFTSCKNGNPTKPLYTKSASPVIIYTSIGQWYSKLHVINDDVETNLFPDDTIKRSYPSLNPQSNKIVYMKNFVIYPMVGVVGNHSIVVADLFATNEKVLLPYDASSKYFYPFWIAESEIALLKQTADSSSYLIIIDSETGSIIKEISLNYKKNIYDSFIYKASDSILCLLCGYSYIAIIDLNTKTLKIDKNVDYLNYFERIQHPLKSGNSVYFLRSRNPFVYVKYNMANNSFDNYSFDVDSVEVVHITDNHFVVNDHGWYGDGYSLTLCDKQFNIIKKINAKCEGVLPYFDNNVYYIAESGDDAYIIVKVNMLTASYEILTQQIDDNFIFDAKIYN